MSWVIDHAPQIAGATLFIGVVYLLLEEMMTRKN